MKPTLAWANAKKNDKMKEREQLLIPLRKELGKKKKTKREKRGDRLNGIEEGEKDPKS